MVDSATTHPDPLAMCVARGETLVTLVDYLLDSERTGAAWAERLEVLTGRFALSFADARVAVDRVEGGRVRAESLGDEPGPATDPIARISWRRARGEQVSADATGPSAEDEREATALWQRACEGDGTQETSSVSVALRLFEQAAATMVAGGDRARKERVLLQTATALSSAAEACIEALGDAACAPEGTQAWADGVRLGECSRQLADFFAALGSRALASRALNLRGRIVTRMLGQCHAHVGRAMLDSARSALGMGEPALAASLCDAVLGDFAGLVDDWEGKDDAPFDEHRMALEHLRVALDLLATIGDDTGDGADRDAAANAILRARCAALLAR